MLFGLFDAMPMYNQNMRRFLKAVTPPILVAGARKVLPQPLPEYEYVPEDWLRPVRGWNAPQVLAAYQAGWNEATAFDANPVKLAYAFALATVARHKDKISLLDWGGCIGQYYAMSRALMPDVEIDYHCKDVPLLAAHARERFSDGHFYSDETCLERRYDFVLASGSVQYSEQWQQVLRGLAQSTCGVLFLNRAFIVDHAPSFTIMQRAYGTEYLAWVWNRTELLKLARLSGLQLCHEFDFYPHQPIHNAPEQARIKGFLFQKSGMPHT